MDLLSTGTVDSIVERLSRVGSELEAVIELCTDRLLLGANRQALQKAEGEARPLEGMVFGVKDLISVAGLPNRLGLGWDPPAAGSDARVVQLLEAAGATLAATLTMTALAGAGRPEPPGISATGVTRNPWDTRRWAGGSSGGSAASVASGLVHFALASESGGSIIVPSAWCGVTGIRPTYGLVPVDGVRILSPTMDKVGVIARSAATCLDVLEQIAPEPFRPHHPVGTVGVLAPSSEWSADAAASLGRGLERFAGSLDVRPTESPPIDPAFASAANTLMSVETALTVADVLRDDHVVFPDPGQRHHLIKALALPESIRNGAFSVRGEAVKLWETVFAQVDAVLTVSSANAAPRLGVDRPDDGTAGAILKSANLAGLPGVSFPCGLSDSGMPVGLHLIGPPRSDRDLLQLVAEFQGREGISLGWSWPQ